MDLQVVINELMRVVASILEVIPSIVNGLIVLTVGYLLASGVRLVLRFVLHRLGFDSLMDNLGLADGLRRIGITLPLSRLVAQAVFLLLLLSFAVTAARLMRLEAVAEILNRGLIFLPNIIAATIVFLIGSLAATYAGGVVTKAGSSRRLGFAAAAGSIVQILLLLFAIVLAVGVLGVDTSILVMVLAIAVAAIGLTLSLALGLGARQIVLDILASYYIRERFPVGQRIAVRNIEGVVKGVGGVNTVVAVGDESVVIPNNLLLKQIVRTSQLGATDAAPPPSQ